MEGFRCFTWSNEYFPDPKRMVKELADKGFKTIVIIDPGIKIDKDYSVYISPDQPKGRIALRDDFQYIWMVYRRIRGKGKSKSNETTKKSFAGLLVLVAAFTLLQTWA